jgi:glutathione synthase/RimK-type ligase-like ATP-grasp enzyme
MRVAIATCLNIPEPDPDEALLRDALTVRGARVRTLAWDAEGAAGEPEPSELVVLRSTWNYFEAPERFLAWVDRAAQRTRIVNPPAIVRGNTQKTYLRELSERGVDVVPTEYVAKGERRRVEDIVRERGWERVVIKPVVSAGSFQTERFDAGSLDAATRFLEARTRERDMMVQRWMPTIETHGERALVWIDGEFTHAVRKSPRFSGGAESVSEAIPIAADERAFAERVLAIPRAEAEELLYARVDVLRDEHGTLRVMELELIEPSLFLLQSPEALRRFVAAIEARAGVL